MQDLNLVPIRLDAIRSFDFWIGRLLSPDGLAKLAKNLGLGWFSEDDIIGLWRIGLLRADLIYAQAPVSDPDLVPSGQIDGITTYCDARRLNHRTEGYGTTLEASNSAMLGKRLAFHPHRLYVLHHVQRTLTLNAISTQFLRSEKGVFTVVQSEVEDFRRWTSSVEFGERFHYWNVIAEIAAITEPVTFDTIMSGEDFATFAPLLATQYEISLRDILLSLGKTDVHRMRQDLAFAAEDHDENRFVHVLLRLMKDDQRNRLKGGLGAAMHFLGMAESIRRASERAFNEALPEEDEIGPGQWFAGARKLLYGSERVFDAPKQQLRDYMTLLGLDFGVKVRCYVEGDTEFGALTHAVGAFGHVQLINLSGSVSERGRKGLAFAESLDADKHSGIFSVVILDGDQTEYIRILRKAAQEERFLGSFFISSPDIEFGNFSASELIGIAVECSQEGRIKSESAAQKILELQSKGAVLKNNTDFWTFLKNHGVDNIRKSEQWGKALMKHAIERPYFPSTDATTSRLRTIIEAARLLIRVRDVGFLRSLSRERLNPETGRIIAREP